MQTRLMAIERLVSQGYRVKKIWDAIPGLESSSGIDKSVPVSRQAGFSWIAFSFHLQFARRLRNGAIFMLRDLCI